MIKIRVLLVDDSKLVRMKVFQILESDQEYEFIVKTREDGEQALRYLCTCDDDNLPDIIILDRNMPNMSGDECIRILRHDKAWQSIPVLFLTAQGAKGEVVKGLAELRADDYLAKPFDDGEMLARVKVLVRMKIAEEHTRSLNKELEKANKFIRKTFGRYLSDEIVDTILESSDGLTLGGDKRTVTIMMTDLRGFTSLGENLPAESVVNMLNIYLDIMAEIILKYQGTIDEFIGDAILAIFGAPIQRKDDAERAVACALEMQLAMKKVNDYNKDAGYPPVAMGIGINTGPVVVGNIGSQKRMKYGVVGSHVNLTSRIESYTVGGQIYISESTKVACGPILKINDQMEVYPKGIKGSIIISDIIGIDGEYNIFLPQVEQEMFDLVTPLPVKFVSLVGKDVKEELHSGRIIKLGEKIAEMETRVALNKLTNIKIILLDEMGKELTSDIYAKIIDIYIDSSSKFSFKLTSRFKFKFSLNFTSLPPVAASYFEKVVKNMDCTTNIGT